MEQLDLTTPETKTIIHWRVIRLELVWGPPATIDIGLVGSNGTRRDFRYSDEEGGTTASTLIRQLNTANLSARSLQRRILERLQVDFPGQLAGTISGVPD